MLAWILSGLGVGYFGLVAATELALTSLLTRLCSVATSFCRARTTLEREACDAFRVQQRVEGREIAGFSGHGARFGVLGVRQWWRGRTGFVAQVACRHTGIDGGEAFALVDADLRHGAGRGSRSRS